MSSGATFLIFDLFGLQTLIHATLAVGNLKHLATHDNHRTVLDLKDNISQYVRNIFPSTLQSAVKHGILRFQMIVDIDS